MLDVVVSHIARGCREISTRPKPSAQVAFAQFWKFNLDTMRGPTLDPVENIRQRQF